VKCAVEADVEHGHVLAHEELADDRLTPVAQLPKLDIPAGHEAKLTDVVEFRAETHWLHLGLSLRDWRFLDVVR
jgi:hypothetical protein